MGLNEKASDGNGMARFTRLLNDATDGDTVAAAALLPAVYDQLRQLAGAK